MVFWNPAAFEEFEQMAKKMRRLPRPTLTAVIDICGLDWVIKEAGEKRLAEHLGSKRFIKLLGGVD